MRFLIPQTVHLLIFPEEIVASGKLDFTCYHWAGGSELRVAGEIKHAHSSRLCRQYLAL